jgi:hypothetical protein
MSFSNQYSLDSVSVPQREIPGSMADSDTWVEVWKQVTNRVEDTHSQIFTIIIKITQSPHNRDCIKLSVQNYIVKIIRVELHVMAYNAHLSKNSG